MQTYKTSRAKENILARIRKELNKKSLPVPYPELDKRQQEPVYTQSGLSDEERFAENFSQLGGKFVFCANKEELLDNLAALYENRGWTKMLCADEQLLAAFS